MENNVISELPKALCGLKYDSNKAVKELDLMKLNFNKSFKPIGNAKKKKIKLTSLGKKTLVVATALAVAPVSVTAIKHLPSIERNIELNDAKEYVYEEIMPEILEEGGYRIIKDSNGIAYIADFSKEDFYNIESSLEEKGFSDESAKYITFEFCNYDANLFHDFGFEDAESFFKNAGYTPQDGWDALGSSVHVYKNMQEEKFIEDVNQIKDNLEVNKDAR